MRVDWTWVAFSLEHTRWGGRQRTWERILSLGTFMLLHCCLWPSLIDRHYIVNTLRTCLDVRSIIEIRRVMCHTLLVIVIHCWSKQHPCFVQVNLLWILIRDESLFKTFVWSCGCVRVSLWTKNSFPMISVYLCKSITRLSGHLSSLLSKAFKWVSSFLLVVALRLLEISLCSCVGKPRWLSVFLLEFFLKDLRQSLLLFFEVKYLIQFHHVHIWWSL
jgi:hypothetical protein